MINKCSVMIVDDNEARAMSLAAALPLERFCARTIKSATAVESALSGDSLHALVLGSNELNGPAMSRVQERFPHAKLICGWNGAIVEADNQQWPMSEATISNSTLAEIIASAAEAARQQERDQNSHPNRLCGMIGGTPEMKELFSTIEKVAGTDATVLILGESGTGKELVARSLHELSARKDKNFVAINCAAIPEELLESELFGHRKGSFTGAISDKIGRFELADKGTLFLDEIGDMKPSLQVKLLRVLQNREIIPVGGNAAKKVDVRIVAATHQDLESMVEKKTFRQDLYYRLSVVPVVNPPLRERSNDIPELLQHFAKRAGSAFGKTISFEADALEALCHYNWPGNVRELENFVERLSILSRTEVVDLAQLPERYKTLPVQAPQDCSSMQACLSPLTNSGISLNSVLDGVEKAYIVQALQLTGGNKKEAAILLGVKRTTLVEKIKRLHIEA